MRVSEYEYQRLLHRLDTPAARGRFQGAIGLPEMTHTQLQNQIREACKLLGLLHYHTHDSRKSEPGYVDSTIIAPAGHPLAGVLYCIELKAGKDTLTDDQQAWLKALACVTRVESGVVRPADLPAFVERLRQQP
jgi:hypothetical protein